MIKPLYHDRPADSGRKASARPRPTTGPRASKPRTARTLAGRCRCFPRTHVLPDGNVYYDAAGQVVNPGGCGWDEVVWNRTSVSDVVAKTWKDLGVPMLGPVPVGFRGSS